MSTTEGGPSTLGYQVFIGNLPFSVDDKSLDGMVSQRVKTHTKTRVATDKMTGRSRGFAFLDFENKEAAESAVAALAGMQCEDRDLKIDLSEPKERRVGGESSNRDRAPRAPRPPSENSVFLGNLDFGTSEDAIAQIFEDTLGAGVVQKVRIAIDRDTGRAKGEPLVIQTDPLHPLFYIFLFPTSHHNRLLLSHMRNY